MELCYKKLDAVKYLWVKSGLKYIFVEDRIDRFKESLIFYQNELSAMGPRPLEPAKTKNNKNKSTENQKEALINQSFLKKNTSLTNIRSIDIFGIPPYRYALTYYNLIFDIHDFDKGQNRRTSLFKNMLKALKWDKGYVFIPCTNLVNKDIHPDPKSFWLKIEELKKQGHNITHVLIFGEDAKKILLSKISFSMPYGVDRYKNFVVISMPSPEDMLPDNRKAKNIVWSFLKQLKRPLT